MKTGIELIAEERQRQIEIEGWTAEHDKEEHAIFMKSEDMKPGMVYHTTHHMHMSIEGCLRNHKGRKIKIFNNEDGSQSSDKEARAYLAECQAKGWKVIPLGEACEGFDYFGGGCPGHPMEENQTE